MQVQKCDHFGKYETKARAVLMALLDKYADNGIQDIEELAVLRVEPLNQFGTPAEIIQLFGGKPRYLQAVKELEYELYKLAA